MDALGAAFAGLLWAWQGRAPAEEYLTGFWGVVGAIVLRGIFVLLGAALLDAFRYTIGHDAGRSTACTTTRMRPCPTRTSDGRY